MTRNSKKSGNHFWYFVDEPSEGTQKIKGPFSESQLLRAAKSGSLRLDTRLRSPSLTNNRWVYANTIEKLADLIHQAEAGAAQAERRKKDGD